MSTIASLSGLRPVLALAAALALGSCGGGGDVDNDLAFRVIHAAPDAPAVNILVDGIAFRSGVPYKGSTGLTFATPRDYTFSVQAIVPGGTDPLIDDVTIPLEAGFEYTVIAIGEGAAGAAHPLQPLVITNPFEEIPADNTRLQFVHAAPDVGPVDVYFTAVPDSPAPLPGLDGATPRAQITYGVQPAARQLAPSDSYVIRITPAGDPDTTLFTAAPLNFGSRLDAMVVMVANTATGDSPVSVLLESRGSVEAIDRDTPARVRAVQLVPDAPALDLIGLPATTSFPEVLLSNEANPSGVALDAANGRALVVDSQLRAVIAVDLGTGARSVFSDDSTPGGANAFRQPVAIAIDTVNNRALVTDVGLAAVLAVDLATGARSVLSGDGVPDTANALSAPAAIAIDAANSRALVVDNRADRLLAVNLQTGARTVLSAAGTPDTANGFFAPVGIAIDGTRALVADNGLDAVLAVDLATGARTILSSSTVPDTANALGSPVALVVDAANGRALVVDNRLRALVAVNLQTGARTILSSSTVPDAVNAFSGPASVALDGAGDALVLDARLGTLFAVDTATGSRTVFSAGAGPTGLDYLEIAPYRDLISDSFGLRTEKSAAPDPVTPLSGNSATFAAGRRSTVFLVGLVATLTAVVAPDETRPVYTEAKLRFLNAAVASGTSDLYLLEAGETVADSDPTLRNLAVGNPTVYGSFAPGAYTAVFTTAGEKTVLATSPPIVGAAGSAQSVIMVDEVRVDAGSDGKPPAIIVLDDSDP
jgi:hypothetical protein